MRCLRFWDNLVDAYYMNVFMGVLNAGDDSSKACANIQIVVSSEYVYSTQGEI